MFGNARVSYDFGERYPVIGLAAHYAGKRPAARAFEKYFTPPPYVGPQVELRLTISGPVPVLPGLSYRASLDYAFADKAPYIVGRPVDNHNDPDRTVRAVCAGRLSSGGQWGCNTIFCRSAVREKKNRCTTRRTLVLRRYIRDFGGRLSRRRPSPCRRQDAGLVIEASTGGDGETPVDAYAHPECRACIAADPVPGPGCGDKLANCVTGCRALHRHLRMRLRARLRDQAYAKRVHLLRASCAAALKITNVNDPSIQLAIRLTECFHSTCKEKCEVADAVEIGVARVSAR